MYIISKISFQGLIRELFYLRRVPKEVDRDKPPCPDAEDEVALT